LAGDDEALRQVEIGLALLHQVYDSAGTRRWPEPRTRFLAETDWAEAWKAGYDVLRIGRRLVVRPSWRDYAPQPGDLVIDLDPGMAFGSGLHPTTRLCLEALEDTMRPGLTVLDVGTGSGILAIAAARLGASRVLALDTDPLAVQIARENVALNQVESVVHVEVGTAQIANQQISRSANRPPPTSNFQLPPARAAARPLARRPGRAGSRQRAREPGRATSNLQSPISDLAVANILAETITELAPALAANLAPGGILIASGIIADRANAVVASLHESGLSFAERRDEGDWVALIACKEGSVVRQSGIRTMDDLLPPS
jgi:ribosomal protein L11 methyltransferase